MSPTRRDVLKLAAALPAIGATMTRADALVGNEPVLPDKHPDAVFDPSSFAYQVEMGTIYDLTGAHGIETAAAERAEYTRARFDLIQLMPELEHQKIPCDHPFIKMDEMMWAICHAAYWEGIRAGAAYEHLRQAIVAPTHVCPRCDGLGLLDRKGEKIWDYDRPNPNDTRTCKDCNGAGVVAAQFLKGWTR